jgi:hypothetical protein
MVKSLLQALLSSEISTDIVDNPNAPNNKEFKAKFH